MRLIMNSIYNSSLYLWVTSNLMVMYHSFIIYNEPPLFMIIFHKTHIYRYSFIFLNIPYFSIDDLMASILQFSRVCQFGIFMFYHHFSKPNKKDMTKYWYCDTDRISCLGFTIFQVNILRDS